VRFAQVFALLLASLALFVCMYAAIFDRIMYDDPFAKESVVGSLYFGAQTITTIGYGDWQPTNAKPDRVFRMKAASVPLMLLGATVFGIAVGFFVNTFATTEV